MWGIYWQGWSKREKRETPYVTMALVGSSNTNCEKRLDCGYCIFKVETIEEADRLERIVRMRNKGQF